jgi:DNA-binding transcriptional ArsR family regulator
MDEALRAIAEPRRRRILELVSEGELSAGEIASSFEVTRPAVSQHLRVLVGAGLLEERRAGTRRYYRACRPRLEELRDWLDSFWEDGLRRLKTAAEAAEQEVDRDGRTRPA